jgi:hypothetical protein
MNFWQKVQKDMQKVQKDVQKGVRESFTVIRKKAEYLTDEGKKKYKVFDLKSKVHKHMSNLGGLVYTMSGTQKNPLQDAKVKAEIEKIKKLEDQITKLETAPVKKKTAKKKAAKKTARKKTAKKTA